MAAVLIDGDGSQYGGLHSKFGRFLHRSLEGQLLDKIMDAPFFVDSKITPGIQIADLVAGVVRLYEERNLFRHLPAGDPFLSAVRRFYAAAHERTVDQETIEGFPRHGFYRMPEDHHYRSEPASIAEEEVQESREEEVTPSGEVGGGDGAVITESQQ